MTTLATLCPACLAVLPQDYPYDHVAIDRAVAGDRWLFRSMSRDERVEVVTLALRRGQTVSSIATRLRADYLLIDELAGDTRSVIEDQIRDLHGQGIPDTTIAVRLGQSASQVQKIRVRLGLPTYFGPRGRRRTAVSV